MSLFFRIRDYLLELSSVHGFDQRLLSNMTLFEYTMRFNDFYGTAITSRVTVKECKKDRRELHELLSQLKSFKTTPKGGQQ